MSDFPIAENTEGLPALDAEALMEAASDDLTEAASLVTLFFRLAAEQFELMRRALDNQEPAEAARAAHRAAGSAATCGFPALESVLRAIEYTATAGGNFERLLEQAGRELQRARQAVQVFLSEGRSDE